MSSGPHRSAEPIQIFQRYVWNSRPYKLRNSQEDLNNFIYKTRIRRNKVSKNSTSENCNLAQTLHPFFLLFGSSYRLLSNCSALEENYSKYKTKAMYCNDPHLPYFLKLFIVLQEECEVHEWHIHLSIAAVLSVLLNGVPASWESVLVHLWDIRFKCQKLHTVHKCKTERGDKLAQVKINK